jgi:hypothetical protein
VAIRHAAFEHSKLLVATVWRSFSASHRMTYPSISVGLVEIGERNVSELIAFPLESRLPDRPNEVVLVEIDALQAGISRAARPGEIVGNASKSLEAALEVVRPTADALIAKIKSLPERPSEVTAEFGIRFTAKAGAVIAATHSEGHVTVALTWKASTLSTGS